MLCELIEPEFTVEGVQNYSLFFISYIIILYFCFLDKMKTLAKTTILSYIKTNYYNWFMEGFINIIFDFKYIISINLY